MNSRLTLKQRKFWRTYCETHNLAASAKAAGSKGKDVRSLSTIGGQILNSLELSMPELLNAQGLTNEYCNKILEEGLKSDRVEIATFQGKIKDKQFFPDYPTRAKYLDIFHKLRGNFIDRHEFTGKDGGDITLVVHKAAKKGEKSISFE